LAISTGAEKVISPDPRRDSSNIGTHLRIALHAPSKAVAFAVILGRRRRGGGLS
jgi:hypothetical protein